MGANECISRHWFRNEADWDADSLSQCVAKTREYAGTLCEGNFVQFPRLDWSTNWGCMCCKPGGEIYRSAPSSNWRLFKIFDFPLVLPSPALPCSERADGERARCCMSSNFCDGLWSATSATG